jgi:membrane protein YdbS with pleckstrin-like domain
MEEEEFHNDPIEIRQLPKVEDLLFTPVKRAYLWVILIGWGFWILIPPVIFYFVASEMELDIKLYILAGWFLLMGLFMTESVLSFFKMGYSLREHDINFRTGWFWKSLTTIPFNRVQHCEVKQGPLESMLKLSSLKVYTAGGGTSDMTIRGLDPDTAKELRTYVTKIAASKREY